MPVSQVDNHTDGHTDPRRAEAPVPAMCRVKTPASEQRLELFALRKPANDQRRGERTEVDAHVEERKAGVASCVAVRVESADERADTRLEQAGAECDEDEPRVEGWLGGERQAVMASGDDEPADQDSPARPDKIIREVAPQDAHHVARHGVVTVDLSGVFLVHPHSAHRQRRDHEQQKDRPHAVVGEPLPHLGVEQHAQPPGVAGDAPMVALGVLGRRFDVWGQFVHRKGL